MLQFHPPLQGAPDVSPVGLWIPFLSSREHRMFHPLDSGFFGDTHFLLDLISKQRLTDVSDWQHMTGYEREDATIE